MSKLPTVAYFCMEYGLDHRFPIYSGGLGILAGDAIKSAGDLRLPMIGIGVLWGQGYTQQAIDEEGRPRHFNRPTPRDALEPLEVSFEVSLGGRAIPCRAYRVNRYTGGTLYLIEPVRASDQRITRRLYEGGPGMRIAQELVLGVGGVRLLRALGLRPDIFHFNEGHALFAGLELVREARVQGASLSEALREVRDQIVFTTHTPVPAGNELHDLAELAELAADLGFTTDELCEIGGEPFSMTAAALQLAASANAVAELHGETARAMWKGIDGAAEIIAITNGVHAPTWQDARVRAATAADKAPDRCGVELWAAHQQMKAELLELVAERTGVQWSTERLLIGFARRAATYKRADLILGDPDRLEQLFARRRVQLLFSGKAHPDDTAGRAVVARLVEAARIWPGNILFLENYDMRLGALLTRGCDVWLNNPRRPMEASGTSGMKAAMNGVLNLSILDGWWPEGCRHGETGWRIGGGGSDYAESAAEYWHAQQDGRDRETLYRALEREVAPRYYDDRAAWIRMMRASIDMSQWQFSSDRMVQDYFDKLYLPTVARAARGGDGEQPRWNRRWRARAG